jgi:predicted RNase H-like HicB family nuclease
MSEIERNYRMALRQVELECGEEIWIAICPDLPGCVGVGETVDAAIECFGDEVAAWIREMESHGCEVRLPESHAPSGARTPEDGKSNLH